MENYKIIIESHLHDSFDFIKKSKIGSTAWDFFWAMANAAKDALEAMQEEEDREE